MIARALQILSLVVFLGCSSTPTEIVVLIDTNVEEQLGWIQLRVTDPDGESSEATANLATTNLPFSQSHVLEDGELGPYLFEATGAQSGGPIVSMAKRASFVSGERRTLRLNLDRSCAFVVCEVGSTCAEGLCGAVETAVLEPYHGMNRHYVEAGAPDSASPDTSVPDASVPDACVPRTEVCDTVDNDCDNNIDEDFDLTADPDNCGSCGVVCQPNAGLGISTATCSASDCTFECAPNFGDCDGDVADGCEDLTTKQACGSCNNRCNGNRTCVQNGDSFECSR